jgi:predicted TIM-barrel enzyme
MEVITMKKELKELIEVYADPELKRRVEMAAAKHNIPIAEYWLDAIEQKLADDVVLAEANHESSNEPKKPDTSILDEIQELRERILARRGGKPIEIDILELVRSERDDELTSMH